MFLVVLSRSQTGPSNAQSEVLNIPRTSNHLPHTPIPLPSLYLSTVCPVLTARGQYRGREYSTGAKPKELLAWFVQNAELFSTHLMRQGKSHTNLKYFSPQNKRGYSYIRFIGQRRILQLDATESGHQPTAPPAPRVGPPAPYSMPKWSSTKKRYTISSLVSFSSSSADGG